MEKDILQDAVSKLSKLGIDHVDVLAQENFTMSARQRMRKPEEVIQAETSAISIRAFIGKQTAVVSTDNISSLRDNNFLEKIVEITKNAPEYDENPQPASEDLSQNPPTIDLVDQSEISANVLLNDIRECEEIVLQSEGITNSDGAEISYDRTKITLMKGKNFFGEYEKTNFGFAVSPLAEKNGELQQNYDFSNAIYYDDLKTPQQLAEKAVQKTLQKIGSRKIKTCRVPVIFDREVSRSLLRNLLSALDGAEIAKGTSFLADKLSQKIFSEKITVSDRAWLDKGLRSRPFDSDGISREETTLIKNGVLNSFLLNTKYANKLKTKSTGNAAGFSGITPNNVCFENGSAEISQLIKDIGSGLLVTEVLGDGFNVVTGNYSQGACGIWIENGELTYPVHEITLAGNFFEMFSNVTVANDLKIETGIDAPSLCFEQMTVGGL